MPHWLRHPAAFAGLAALFWLAVMATGGVAAPHWHSGPLAELGEDLLDIAWLRDIPSGSAHIETSFDAQDSPGVSAVIGPRAGGQAGLAVRWRRAGDPQWYGHAQPHHLGRTHVSFDLAGNDEWSGEISEITFSTLHGLPLQYRALRIEANGPIAALRHAWFDFAGGETYWQSSLNWLGGARVGDADWAWWLALTWVGYCVLWLSTGRRTSQTTRWTSIASLALLLWVFLDVRHSVNLFHAAAFDRGRFPALAAADAVVDAGGPAYRALVDAIREHVPPTARVGFVSADPSFLIRSRYVFFPRPIVHPPRRWFLERPDYVALFADRQVRYESDSSALALGKGVRLPVQPIIELGDGVGLFRVDPPAIRRRPKQPPSRSQESEP